MPRSERGRGAARHAITDLYDVERGTFLVRYPVLLVVALSLSGVLAFGLTGLFGLAGWPSPVTPVAPDPAFTQPWPLYLWFAALMITLLASIFRDASLRRRLIVMLAVAVLAVLVVGAVRFSQSLPEFLRQLLNQHRLFGYLSSHPLTYIVINFGLLAAFWLDTFRRWIRRARGLPPNPRVSIGVESSTEAAEMPDLQELIAGDMIAGAVLALILAILFRTDIVARVVHITPPVSDCLVSLATSCPLAAGAHLPPTITFVDVIQALIYQPLGLMILALTATLSGLGAVGGVHDSAVTAQLTLQPGDNTSGTLPIAEDVATTIVKTLQAALDRRMRSLGRNLALSLRMVGWPSLLFLAAYGLTDLSVNIQGYLHSAKHFDAVLSYVLPAAIWGIVAVLTMVCSAALMLFKWRVVDNTLRFMGLIGFVVVLTFWIFSLALFGFNELLLNTRTLIDRTPFAPSFATAASAAALVIFGIYFGLRRGRGVRAKPETEAVPVAASEPATPPGKS
ncbi:MAG: hypothetical protein ACHQ4H_00540 [Ktedonobacterales bacterium]